MLQKTKSLLTKLLMLLCVACCAVALAFSLAGCSGVTVDHMEIRDGNLWVIYSDGTEVDLGKVQGEDGEPGETPDVGKVVESVSVEGNTVTITYTDGSTETFEIQESEDETCEHANMEFVVLEADGWTCDEGGEILEVCSDCGYTQIVDIAPGAHVTEVVTHAPTCVVDGYDAATCVYCGTVVGEKTNIVEHTGVHEFAEKGYEVAKPGSTLCEGGWVVYPCVNNCGYVKYEELAPKGHTVDEVTVETLATPDNAGKASAYCSSCGQKIEFVLPQINAANLSKYEYTITAEEINCTAEMKAHFTYTDKETGLTVEFDSTLPGGLHKLNGEAYDDKQVITYTGADSLPEGMELAANGNQAPACSDVGVYAVFTCSDCGRPVVVKVRVPHTKPANSVAGTVDFDTVATGWSQDGDKVNEDGIPVNASGLTKVEFVANYYKTSAGLTKDSKEVYSYKASCTEQGFEVYWCSVCGAAVADIADVLEHEYVYTAAPVAGKDNQVQITAKCENCTSNGTIVLEDCTTQVVSEVSCEDDGITTYTGKVTGTPTGIYANDKYKEGTTVTITAVTPKTNHIHPVYGDEFDDNAETPYDVNEYPDMELAANSGENCADPDPVYGTFVCEDCGKPVVIPMQWGHKEPAGAGAKVVDVTDPDGGYTSYNTAEAARTYLEGLESESDDYTTVLVKPATCEADGFRAYICSDCGKVRVDTVAKLGHAIKYNFTKEDPADTYTLETVCANECGAFNSADTGYVKITGITVLESVDDVNEGTTKPYAYVSAETDPTCTAAGTRTIIVVTETATLSFTEDTDDAAHKLNGKYMDDDAYYDPDLVPGIEVSANYDLTCDGEGGLGIFTCEVCGRPVVVKVRDAHTAPTKTSTTLPEGTEWASITVGDTEAVYNNTAVTDNLAKDTYYSSAASCDADGKYIYFCKVCAQWIAGPVKATGHDIIFSGYTWDNGTDPAAVTKDYTFTVNFKCATKGCAMGEKPITLTPFVVDGTALTLNKGFTLVSFNAPTHNTFGNFTVKYTVTAQELKGAGISVADDKFTLEVTLSGDLDSAMLDEGLHFHIVDAPDISVEPGKDPYSGDGKTFYWFESTFDKAGNETDRTYYVATICLDCGEMYVHNELTQKVSGEDIPESDLPCLSWAQDADKKAAEEDTAGSEADAA